MNLDLTRERLIQFQDALERFVDVLAQATKAEEEASEALTPLWGDAFAKDFIARHDELREPVARFAQSGAEKCHDFVDRQIGGLGRYLDGGR
ncbi:MAG TPA: hypothetical protein PKE40_01155 [Arachnia sp.]|nr:hypothetical protein [Arachnia sp.]HMT84935.1 hypothetical protein [Arachnia sp.]